jgi:hypothetical protein
MRTVTLAAVAGLAILLLCTLVGANPEIVTRAASVTIAVVLARKIGKAAFTWWSGR